MSKISVIIPTYNRCDILSKTIDSLINQTLNPLEYEIIICDSNSVDGTDYMIDLKMRNSKCKILYTHTDNVLATKRNHGAKISSSKYLLFIDDDCVPEGDFLDGYLKIISNKKYSDESVICGGVKFDPILCKKSNYYRFRNSCHELESLNLIKIPYYKIVVMNMLISKEILISKLGGFDEEFTGYGCEDTEFGWRCSENNVPILGFGPSITHNEPSGNIRGYSTKLHRASRDGMGTLIERAPSAAWSLRYSRYLEPEFPSSNFQDRALASVVRGLTMSWMQEIAIWLCMRVDAYPSLYSRWLFRYILLSAYVKGCKDRMAGKARTHVSGNWYE